MASRWAYTMDCIQCALGIPMGNDKPLRIKAHVDDNFLKISRNGLLPTTLIQSRYCHSSTRSKWRGGLDSFLCKPNSTSCASTCST